MTEIRPRRCDVGGEAAAPSHPAIITRTRLIPLGSHAACPTRLARGRSVRRPPPRRSTSSPGAQPLGLQVLPDGVAGPVDPHLQGADGSPGEFHHLRVPIPLHMLQHEGLGLLDR